MPTKSPTCWSRLPRTGALSAMPCWRAGTRSRFAAGFATTRNPPDGRDVDVAADRDPGPVVDVELRRALRGRAVHHRGPGRPASLGAGSRRPRSPRRPSARRPWITPRRRIAWNRGVAMWRLPVSTPGSIPLSGYEIHLRSDGSARFAAQVFADHNLPVLGQRTETIARGCVPNTNSDSPSRPCAPSPPRVPPRAASLCVYARRQGFTGVSITVRPPRRRGRGLARWPSSVRRPTPSL